MTYTRTTTKNLGLIFGAVACWLVLFGIVHVKPAKALTLIPDPPATSIPAVWKTYLETCDTRSFSPALVQWISPSGNAASAGNVTVPYGTTTIPMNLHYAGAVCFSSSVVSGYQTHISAASAPFNPATNVTGLAGKTPAALNFTPYNQVGRYDRDANDMPFNYNNPGGFKTNTSYTIRVTFEGINTRVVAPTYDCTRPASDPTPINPGSATNFAACPQVTIDVTVNVTIAPDTAPTLKVAAACDGNSEPTTFQVTSGDADAVPPGLANVYSVDWQLQNSTDGGATWTNGPVNSGTTAVEFGGTVVTHNVPFKATPSDTTMHRIVANTDGYGVPRNVQATSNTWGPCTPSTNPDKPPEISITYDCNLFGTGKPGFTVHSGDPDYDGTNNANYNVQYIIRDATDTVSITSGNMPTPWGGTSPELSHNYNMTTLPGGYNPLLAYVIHTSTLGITAAGAVGTISRAATLVFPPCSLPPACGGLSTIPTQVTPGDPFQVVLTATYAGAANPPANFNVSVSPSFSYTESQAPILGGESDTLTSSATGVPPGTYTVNWQYVSTLGSSPPCTGQFTVIPTTTPYLGIYGGDAFAGGGFAPGCSTTDGSITTALNSAGLGAGDQLAAFALGNISNFNSAELRTSSPTRPTGLSFANVGIGSPGSFSNNNCISAYPMVTTGTAVSDPLAGWSGITNYNAGGLITNGGTVAVKQHFSIYIKGNLVIKNNIIYDTGTAWNSVADIPSATFIVQGNIYIDQGVTQLDGTYVAEPNGPGTGIISTCINGSTAYKPSDLSKASFQTGCGQQLIVHGSLVAQHIDWLRTYGDVKQATLGENPYDGSNPNCPAPAHLTCAGEVIINGPESYMGQPSTTSLLNSFDYFTGLPPVL